MNEADYLIETLIKILEAKTLALQAREGFLAYLVDMAVLEARTRLNIVVGDSEDFEF